MFKFFKDKLKKAIGKFSKDIETDEEIQEIEEPIVEQPKQEEPVEKEVQKEPVEKKRTEKPEEEAEPVEHVLEELKTEPESEELVVEEQPVEKEPEEKTEEPVEKITEKKEVVEETEKSKGFFEKIKDSVTKRTLTEAKFDQLFWELEIVLLENNVAVEVIEKVKQGLKNELVDTKIPMGGTEEIIEKALSKTIGSLFDVEQVNLLKNINSKSPYVILFLGVNGAGKTTTIAKVAHKLQNQGKTCVVAAADTFRAAAIQQLEEHANNLGIKLIKHDYGSDPAAVAFDSIKYAESKGMDAVLIDTAGRQHSNSNLMEEMKKIVRISNPDLKVFIGESITGNDCIEQAKSFDDAVGIDGIILSKADVDEKGGTAISISYVTKRPIMYIGTGQGYDDLTEFDKNMITKGLDLI